MTGKYKVQLFALHKKYQVSTKDWTPEMELFWMQFGRWVSEVRKYVSLKLGQSSTPKELSFQDQILLSPCSWSIGASILWRPLRFMEPSRTHVLAAHQHGGHELERKRRPGIHRRLHAQLRGGEKARPPSGQQPPHDAAGTGTFCAYSTLSLQGGPTELHSGNWSILDAVWEISIYFYYDINTYQWRS